MTIKIDEGKFYRTRDGRKVGPMRISSSNIVYCVGWQGNWYADNGRRGSGPVRSDDIVAEWTDTPKTWGEMTPEEKGALLLADHEGVSVEEYQGLFGWQPWDSSDFCSDNLLRVRPEPSHLPLTAGKRYKTARKGKFECIYTRDSKAWLIPIPCERSAAYVWDAQTGEALSLSEGKWDVTGLAE